MTNYSTANSKKVVLRKSQTLTLSAQRVMSNLFLGLLIGKITPLHLARSVNTSLTPVLKHL